MDDEQLISVVAGLDRGLHPATANLCRLLLQIYDDGRGRAALELLQEQGICGAEPFLLYDRIYRGNLDNTITSIEEGRATTYLQSCIESKFYTE